MTSNDMKQSMLHPEKRHLEILSIKNSDLADESIKMLMGEEVDERKEFLFANVDFSKLNK